MVSDFHDSTFYLLDIEPRVSEQRLAAIASRERMCNLRLPASIKQWFCVEDAELIFHENTEHDLTDYRQLGDPSDVAQGYLRVATENQAVVAWYARLDGSDDPPVFDNSGEFDRDLPAIDWVFCSKDSAVINLPN